MLETILAAIILGKIKHFKIRFLFFTWSFYPVLIMQCILIFFQICALFGNYYFVQFASYTKIMVIISFVFPMLVFQLYKPALIGSGSIVVGTLLNKFVIFQNNGKMPVFPSFSYLTGYVKPYTFQAVRDIHILGTAASHWKILSDYIDFGYSILSIGDLFIHFFSFLLLYYTIKSVNLKFNSKSSHFELKGDINERNLN
jgi:hypothetical protein